MQNQILESKKLFLQLPSILMHHFIVRDIKKRLIDVPDNQKEGQGKVDLNASSTQKSGCC